MEFLMATKSGTVSPPVPPPPSDAQPEVPPPPPAILTKPIASIRIKHKRVSQDEVAHFSSFPDMKSAVAYAKDHLVPREKSDGTKWRIRPREDGREDKSLDKQWRCHRSVAIAIGALMANGMTYDEGLDAIQARFESHGVQPHTRFLKAIDEEIKLMQKSEADGLARMVLGL